MELVLDYLEGIDPDEFQEGRTELSEPDVFVNAMHQFTKSEEDAVWESHEKHIDIHYLVDGHELVKYAEEYKMDVEVLYDEKKDCTLFVGSDGLNVNIPKGGFVIFFPDEIHKTMVADGIPARVKKLVGKIRVE
jgi:biofilm protein TabA